MKKKQRNLEDLKPHPLEPIPIKRGTKPSKHASTDTYCKACGMVWYNCLCYHEED